MKKNKVWTQEEIKNVERREMRRGKEQDGDKRDTLSWVAARDERVKGVGVLQARVCYMWKVICYRRRSLKQPR